MKLLDIAARLGEMRPGDRYFAKGATFEALWPDPKDILTPDDHLTVAERAANWLTTHNVNAWQSHDPIGVYFERKPAMEGVMLQGGPCDGQRIVVKGSDVIEMEEPVNLGPVGRRIGRIPSKLELRKILYRRSLGNPKIYVFQP